MGKLRTLEFHLSVCEIINRCSGVKHLPVTFLSQFRNRPENADLKRMIHFAPKRLMFQRPRVVSVKKRAERSNMPKVFSSTCP